MRFEFSSDLPVPAHEAYAWHTRPGAIERLIPPWEAVRIEGASGGFEDRVVTLVVPVGPTHAHWKIRHREVVPGRQFVDEQVQGPFAHWTHTHLFEPTGTRSCRLVDRIVYRLPLGPLGAVGGPLVRDRLHRGFRYRHATLRADLEAFARTPAGPLTIAITGAGGLIGRSLIPLLTTCGHRVRRLVRGRAAGDDIPWDPSARRLDPEALAGVDAVVHLAGEPIAERWTDERRRRIMESRAGGTAFLSEVLAALPRPPRVLVTASAVGIYGDRGDDPVSEDTTIRTGDDAMFVERVGHSWEAATGAAERAGIRVAKARFGVVLTPAGGALRKMLPAFLAGVGGRLGNGRQVMSWIGIDDAVGAILHVISNDRLRGPVNLTAPGPVTNREFTATLAGVIRRPARFPVPAWALRLGFGEMAGEVLLAGARVLPSRLLQTGYVFRHPDLGPALGHVLGREPPGSRVASTDREP